MHFADPTQPRLARWILVAGMVFFIVVVLAATAELLATVARLAEAPFRRLGPAGVGVLVTGLAALIAAAVAGFWAGKGRWTDRQLMLAALCFVLVVRGAIVLVHDAPLPNDGRAYQELARWLAAGGCCFADRPTGYPMLLAAAYRLVGDGTWVHEAVNVLAAVAGGWLLLDLVSRACGRIAAAMAVAIYAVLPGLALLTPLLLTDTVYATILLALCWATMRMGSGRAATAAMAGVLLAISQYVRPVAPALLPAMALVPLLYVRPLRRGAMLLAVLLFAFTAGMLPAIANNLAEHGDVSASTSSYGGWSLLMGTNQQADGRYNDGDATLIDSLPGATLWDRSEVAGQLGLERIADDPIGFAGLAVRKFRVMWGTEEFAVIFAFRPHGPARGALAGLDLLANVAYLGVTLAAAAALATVIRRRGPPDPLLVVVVGLLLCEAAVHTFLEVKPRYHALDEPLFLVLGAPALAAFASRWLETSQRQRTPGARPQPAPEGSR